MAEERSMILEGTAYGRPRPTYDPLITEVGREHRAANISGVIGIPSWRREM